jgi:type I restriction enzyme, S subunit
MTASTLADVCSVITDGAHNSPKSVELGGLPMASVKDLTPSGINLTSCRRISADDFHILVRQGCKPLPGDVLIAKDGATALDTVCVVKKAHDVVLLSSVAILRPDPTKIRSHYLRYFLEAPSIRSFMKGGLITGAAIPRVVLKDFKRCPIQVPDLKQQEAVCSILSAYDDLIENNTRRIKVLEDVAQMIYREWFVNFRFPGHEYGRMVESEVGPIPENWFSKCVTDAVFVNPATKVPKEGIKPFLPMGSLSENSMLINDVEEREGNSGAKFKNGDTLFARITPCLENGKTGFVQFLPSDDAVAFGSTEFIVLRSKTVCPEYVYLMARSSEFRDNAIKSMSGATGRQRVQEACFNGFFIAQPDTATIGRFTELVRPMFRLIHSLNSRNRNLRTTRDFLLPKLISGEVPVETADEAAAELMEQTA